MELQSDFEADVHAINAIPVVSTILEVICRTTGIRFAAIARVTEDRWVCCAVRDEIEFGIEPGGELDIETTFCHTIRHSMEPVVIANVAEDRTYAEHPIPAMYGFQSYISFPIVTKQGDFFGTLCAIDTKPVPLKSSEIISMFNLFGDLIAFHLNVVDELAQSETNLVEEKNTAELREQFIAILGHDLRNPLSAVLNISQLLLRMPLDEQVKSLATILLNSSYRMKELIDNILDFANGRLGDGIILNQCDNADLEDILNHVIDELLLIWPNREINAEFNLNGTVYCDGQRMAQVFSNLLGNALRHGKPGSIVIEA
ncbi:MAG: GAF domain-containing sensor histidine kinase [Abditibacteriaceae bacterium]